MAPRFPRSFRTDPAGFSLLEVLVSTAILALLIVLFAALFSSAQDGLKRLSNSIRQRQDARIVLANMAKELRTSIAPPAESYEGNDAASRQIELLINPPSMNALANANNLFWATSSSSSAEGSGLVGYAVRWDQSNPSAPRPRFCRMFVPASKSQAVLADLKSSNSASWPTTPLFDTYAAATATNGYQGWLADNVLALYVRALDPENQPIVRAARTITGVSSPDDAWYIAMSGVTFSPSTDGPSYTNSYDSRLGYQYQPSVSGATLVNRFGPAMPASIEIVLVTATPDAINRLTAALPATPGNSATTMWTDVDTYINSLPENLRRNVRVFSTIVSLSAQP